MSSTPYQLEKRSQMLNRTLNSLAALLFVVAVFAWWGLRISRGSQWITAGGAHPHLSLCAEWSLVELPFLALALIILVNALNRMVCREMAGRTTMEDELRRERSTLEKRVDARTSELQAEVAERKRAEQLNHGRSLIFEMVARETSPREILRTLTDVVARDRSSWCCALHLHSTSDELVMEASSGLPQKLISKLSQLALDMSDAPEAIALRENKSVVLDDLSKERKPWPQFLHAYGIQSLWATAIYSPDGTPLGTLTIYSLLRYLPSELDRQLLEAHSQMAAMVLERYRLQEELRRHAFHDSLTGLPNRLLGEKELSASIARAQRNHQNVAVLWLDLDKFKETNDVHGHVAGDAVLKETARRLASRFRQNDTVARMGGDEFMAVLEDIQDRDAAAKIASELLQELNLPVSFQGLLLNTAASIGISMFPEDGESADQLQRNADLAMYEAKFGRHGFRIYAPTLDSALTERRQLEEAMIHALKHDGFQLHYQPVFEATGYLTSFEALLRFPHPELGMIPPARMIPIAEESQMIVAIGSWVLREACRQNRRWQDSGLPAVPIAVNISAMQFVREDFADEVAQILIDANLQPNLLELELTESLMVKDFEESKRQLQRLKKLGVKIAVDDFGTGYSSLNSLYKLPIDRLKIDRSFTQAIGEPNGTLPIVEGIITMAHSMSMRVVAEGVETDLQMRNLQEKGCDFLQGYLFSKPVNAEFAARLLGSRDDGQTRAVPIPELEFEAA